MGETPEYTLFVNSTDSFEDTWEPFFTLLSRHWPQTAPVVLNTETKTYAHPDLDVRATCVARPGETRVPWGECMLRALDQIPTELFVYLQDDYFLYAPVMTDVVDEAARIMVAEKLDCLRLMECGGGGPWEPTPYPWLWSLSRTATYRIALQAGLWTKTGMRKYLKAHESPWQMEIWGSRRARRISGRIWCVSRDVYHETKPQVVPYVPTGIVKGRWSAEVVKDLFEREGIELDYGLRGWYDPAHPPRSSLAAKFRKLPGYAWARVRSL